MKKSQWADQLGWEKASPAERELQDLHDTGQQQDNWKDSQLGSNIDGVTEARDLEPDQMFIDSLQ